MKRSPDYILRSFLEGAVDVSGLYTVCSTLADPTWLVVDPRKISDNDCEATNTRNLQPLHVNGRVTHVVIPIIHGDRRWTIAIAALRERKIRSFQPSGQDELHARSFSTARQLCSRTQLGAPDHRWLEERCDCAHPPSAIEDEGIRALVYVVDIFSGNSTRKKVVLPAWRWALALTYAAIEGISAFVPIPLTFTIHMVRRTTNICEIVHEQSENLIQLQRYQQQPEAALDACLTLQARLDDILQGNSTHRSEKDKATAVLEPGVSKQKSASTVTDGDVPETSRICLLKAVKSALRRSQEAYEDFLQLYGKRQQAQIDEINDSTKRRRTS